MNPLQFDAVMMRQKQETTDTRDLDQLADWLEYGKTSGYIAARCSKAQEEYWAIQLRELIHRHRTLLAEVHGM